MEQRTEEDAGTVTAASGRVVDEVRGAKDKEWTLTATSEDVEDFGPPAEVDVPALTASVG